MFDHRAQEHNMLYHRRMKLEFEGCTALTLCMDASRVQRFIMMLQMIVAEYMSACPARNQAKPAYLASGLQDPGELGLHVQRRLQLRWFSSHP
eukprot:1312617-Alexandrium_andersonii.AAC.1